MSLIYIVRHAQSIGNVEKRLTGRNDYILTEEGKKQVEQLTQRLKNIHFDVAYSSNTTRTIETIRPLAEMNNLKINIDDGLSEMYFGNYDGLKWEEVNKIDPKIDRIHQETNEIAKIPNQETTEQVTDRMYNTILKIVNQNKNKTILIASHGVAIEAFLRQITKEPFILKREEYSQKNTSINILQFNEIKETFKLRHLNDVKHLNKKI